ncbi:hypothetical protein ACIRSU_15330 [Streptomyces sp. NPDC101160]|uniref:hypothetical protein n=1 Tax=Streptomyces sp. NPDC101160 TaxID=3366118 RepID=UPI00382905BC
MNATQGPRSAGALLLCRAEPAAVRPPAGLLREQLLLAPAGPEWSVLVPEGKPWLDDGEPVDRVVTGWATALAVAAAGWPVLALWWDRDRAGFTLASGFRRTVGYVWLADGTPVGEDEAMRTFADRLALDPVLDVQALEPLTRPDRDADAHARLVGLAAVLARTGLALPEGLSPGESADRLRSAAHARGAELLDVPGRWDAVRAELLERAGWRDAVHTVRAELDAVEGGRLGPYLRGPRARLIGAVQLAAGVPLLVWGIARRSGGWTTAGVLLVADGALGIAYDRLRGA